MSHYSVLLNVMDIYRTLRIIQVKQTKKVGNSSSIPFDSVKNRIAWKRYYNNFNCKFLWTSSKHELGHNMTPGSYNTVHAVLIFPFCAIQGAKSVTVPTPRCVWSMALCTPSLTGRWCPKPAPVCRWSSSSTASWVESSQRDASRSARSSVLWRRRWFLRVSCRSTTFISK